MKKLAADLKAVNKEIKALAKKLERLSLKADKLMKAGTRKPAKKKPGPKKGTVKSAKAAAKKTAPKAAKKPAAKAARTETPTNQVLTLMKNYKQGVTVAKLKERSGLNDKQISNILHRANKSGKITRIARGVYTLA